MPPLDQSDYAEPRCLLDMTSPAAPPVDPIDAGRVIQKLDEYLSRNDKAGAERHLLYWLEEARAGHDRRGEHTLKNELMGFYRKEGREEEAVSFALSALSDLKELGLLGTVTEGTCLVNTATVYYTFNRAKEAQPYFEKARVLYEKYLPPADARLGGLYNNMGLNLVDLKRFEEAISLYEAALAVMRQTPGGELEEAITLLNEADALARQYGTEQAEPEIESRLEEALKKLDAPGIQRNGYYAFVCEKCAPTFGYYGHFFTRDELISRAKEIYERA